MAKVKAEVKSAYRKKMDATEQKAVVENMHFIHLMCDEPLTEEQKKIVEKALSYCWVDGMMFSTIECFDSKIKRGKS